MAATLLEKSGCYAEPGIAFSTNPLERFKKTFWARNVKMLGIKWANKIPLPWPVQQLWSILYKHFDSSVCDLNPTGRLWKIAALRLLAIADEACVGFGWLPDRESTEACQTLFMQYISSATRVSALKLQLPYSVAWLVPSDIACVQPKANTPQVGCTLRSMSHHLALLPGSGTVETEWHISTVASSLLKKSEISDLPFNILLVPYPYTINGSDFIVTKEPTDNRDGYFSVKQSWLTSDTASVASKIAELTINLIGEAKKDVDRIDCIVFPEAALTPDIALEVSSRIARFDHTIEMVICGTLHKEAGRTLNEARIYVLALGRVVETRLQRKHHRWKLDAAQIRAYNLGGSLHPRYRYWEDIELQKRKLRFGVFRGEAVITALVCEDLARADPVMPVLCAIGPNLVVALLMDGPQLVGRWSGRYATILADDPGAAILTLTSLGMVRRSRVPNHPLPGDSGRRCIGLWREPGGDAHELDLPVGAHGIIMSLSPNLLHQRTLDARTDGGMSHRFSLSAVRAVAANKTFDWLDYP